jgi:lipopolysaccharide transport system ATP-binding protein
MSSPIISVENLSKSYTISHQSGSKGKAGGYRRFSEELLSYPRQLLSRLTPNAYRPSSTQEEFWALKDVSFEVNEGEVVGIIGRNGAGKSTLLKILSRITEPTGGRVTLRGRVASLLEVGTGFHPELTGRENVFLNGAILGMTRSEIRQKFDEIVDFAGVEKFLDTPVKRYSSGMYVRLAFAVAAHLEPEILVVDEVLAVGDAEFQKKCMGKMKDVAACGRTVLFVSHNITAVLTLCKTAVLLKQGQLQKCGFVHDVASAYWAESSTNFRRLLRSGEAGIAITSVQVRNDAPVQFCGSLELEIGLDAWGFNSPVVVSFGLSDNSGQRIATFDSVWDPDSNCRVFGFVRAHLIVKRVHVSPGSYGLAVGAASICGTYHDYQPECGKVDVVAGDGTPVFLRGAPTNSGVRQVVDHFSLEKI